MTRLHSSIARYSGSMSLIFIRKLPEDTICQPEKCISLDNSVAQLSPRIDRSVRFVKPFCDPCRFDYCMLLLIFFCLSMCVCIAVQFVNELLSINMNTLNRIPKQTRQCVYTSFSKPMPSKVYRNARKVVTPRSKGLCRQPKVCTSEPVLTNKQGKCVCLVLKACADEQTGEVCITRCKVFLRSGARKKWMS